MSKEKSSNSILEWIKSIAIALVIAFIIRQFIFAPILVDGVSMMPTLQDGDRMIVNKFSTMFKDPERFDIIVFKATESRDYIKRVIGLPGDHIEYKNDELFINGKKYEEPYLAQYKKEVVDGRPLTDDFKLEENTGQAVVPEGHLFVMGDNRRFSKDSRQIGFVSMDAIFGKTSVVYWPMNEIRIVK